MSTGQLRVYLGMAPGVGKTYAMLAEGWRRKQRGADVVVGYYEDHRRPFTAEQIRDLEVIPRKVSEYRGQHMEEMDVDAVVERRPEIVLVDELAHTNVAGSRHRKRWEDVETLLEAGIDVVTTVNVQHLESLQDVVERVTGIEQHETVPDAFVRRADQIELVDMSPDALQRRLRHGNVYPAERIDTALTNYFRTPNLTALRELALLWVADRVDDELQEYRKRHDIEETWDTREKVVVAITNAAGEDEVIRRAARSASRSRSELVAIHVRPDDGLAQRSSETLDHYVNLVREFDGVYREVVGADVARALVDAARAQRATQIFLGESDRTRWHELWHGSTVGRVVRLSGGGLDVHVISTKTEVIPVAKRPLQHPKKPGISLRRRIWGAVAAVVGLPLLTLVVTQMRSELGLQNASMVYLLAIVAISIVGGILPATIAAFGSFFLLNYFFTEPVHTFTVRHGRDVFTLAVFVIVGISVSFYVDLAERRKREAFRARAEAQSLARMAAAMADESNPLPVLLNDVAATFHQASASVVLPTTHGWEVDVETGIEAPQRPSDATTSIELTPGAYLLLKGDALQTEERTVLDSFATQLSIALESRRLQKEAHEALAHVRANEVRSALLAAVSHDLRTPLASIKTAVTSLLSRNEFDGDQKELLQTVDTEADRLHALVANLLDMSRIRSGALAVDRRPVWLEEVVAAAMDSLSFPSVPIVVKIHDDVPRVVADAGLLERVLANLLQNAIDVTPLGSNVMLVADRISDHVTIRVEDHGPGIPADRRGLVFQPFQRFGDRPNGRGVGLGLAVAKGFVEIMDGEIDIDDTPEGGTTMIVTLPSAS